MDEFGEGRIGQPEATLVLVVNRLQRETFAEVASNCGSVGQKIDATMAVRFWSDLFSHERDNRKSQGKTSKHIHSRVNHGNLVKSILTMAKDG